MNYIENNACSGLAIRDEITYIKITVLLLDYLKDKKNFKSQPLKVIYYNN